MFILASNGTTAAAPYSVKVKVLVFTVDPEELETVPGKTPDFTLKAKNIPQKYTSVRFAWDFGDGTPVHTTAGSPFQCLAHLYRNR